MSDKKIEKQTNDEDFLSPVKVVSSGIRYFLISILFLTLVVLLWGILGKVPVNVNGIGMIFSKSQEKTINTNYSGIVAEFYKLKGDTIHQGDRLLRLDEFDILQTIDETQLDLNQQYNNDSIRWISLLEEKRQKIQSMQQGKEKINKTIASTKDKITYYEKFYKEQRELLEKGIITEIELKNTEFNLQELKISLTEQNAGLNDLNYEEKLYNNNIEQQLNQLKSGIIVLQEKLKNLSNKNERYSYITSIYDAVIQEVLVNKNEVIGENRKIYTIKLLNDESDVYVDVFIPYDETTKVDKRSDVVVAPFNVDKNRYGQIVGKIAEMNEFPATQEFMSNLLVNEDMVKLVSSQGPVYYCKVTLEKDAHTISGLKWTSRKGAPFKINSGMICDIEIRTDYVSPVSFVIPWIKKEMKYE